jgi:hypothetical protein
MRDMTEIYETSYRANIAKLEQLRGDAHAKYLEHLNTNTDDRNRAYWSGMEDGFIRALRVLRGEG